MWVWLGCWCSDDTLKFIKLWLEKATDTSCLIFETLKTLNLQQWCLGNGNRGVLSSRLAWAT